MKINDILDRRTWDLPLIEKDNNIFHVFAILSGRDHIWVVDNMNNKNVVGVITEHDILHAFRPIKHLKFFGVPTKIPVNLGLFASVEQIMSPNPVMCSRNEKVMDVLDKMMLNQIRRVAIVEGNSTKIIGEVTLNQLIGNYYHAIKPLYNICARDEGKYRF